MKYSDWKLLTKDEKQQVKIRHRPPVRIATLFSGAFLMLLLVVVYKTLKTRTIHVNRNPNTEEAYTVAKQFIGQKLKLPETAIFPRRAEHANADTARKVYQLQSSVKAQETSGKQVTLKWSIRLQYTGGDWEDQQSWKVQDLQLNP